MFESPTLRILIIALGITLIGVAAAQDFDPDNPDVVQDPKADSNYHCEELRVKMLYAATVVGDPDQESYLRAAQAYQLLQEAGQKC